MRGHLAPRRLVRRAAQPRVLLSGSVQRIRLTSNLQAPIVCLATAWHWFTLTPGASGETTCRKPSLQRGRSLAALPLAASSKEKLRSPASRRNLAREKVVVDKWGSVVPSLLHQSLIQSKNALYVLSKVTSSPRKRESADVDPRSPAFAED